MDDHGLFRESLKRLLESEPDLKIVASCATPTEAFRALENEPADVVLLDYDLGDHPGTTFLEEARLRGLKSRVLMVTAGMPDAITLRAFENGVAGVFLKHSPPAQLVDAIHRVAAGEMWLDPKAVPALVAGATAKASEQPASEPLTARERVVLRSVFEGLTNKEIAARMGISESLVKAVLQQLFDKTGVRTRSQLVRIAIEKHSDDWLGGS